MASKRFLAIGAGKTLPMPWFIAVSHSSLSDDFAALDALCGKLVLIAFRAIDVVVFWDEGLGSNRVFARTANKTFLMPLPCLVFHLLHASSEDVVASITPCGKLCIVARAAVNPIGFRAKLFINQRGPAFRTNKT